MKLLLLTERFPPDAGGVARSAFRTAMTLAGLGIEVHVVAWSRVLPAGQLDTEVIEPLPCSADTSADHDPPPGPAQKLVVHRLGMFASWDLSLQHTHNVLDWLHQQVQFNVVWGHYVFPAGFMSVLFARTRKLLSTVSARGNDIDRLMFPPGDFSRLVWTLEGADVVTSVSADLAHKINVLVHTTRPVVVLKNVVDADEFGSAGTAEETLQTRRDLNIPEDAAVLGFCGELRHKKGLPFLLHALEFVNQVRPARLLVIGDVRPREQSTISTFELEYPGIQERIVVTGHSEDRALIASRLRACDVVLQPSLWDGMPNSVLEAMACARIVVASDAGGIPEIITPGENGFLISRSELHRLGEGILEVLSLPDEERERIGNAARQCVLDDFHPNLERSRLLDVMHQLCPDAVVR